MSQSLSPESPQTSARLLPLLLMLGGGVVAGALLPPTRHEPGTPGTESGAQASTQAGLKEGHSSANAEEGRGVAGFKTSTAGAAKTIPSERLVPLFQRATKLKNETKQYAVTYQLASLMGVKELDSAMEAAMADAKKGDTVAIRALARRWAEIDPGGAAQRALETKSEAFAYPLIQSWKQMTPSGPYEWARNLPQTEQAAAFKMLLNSRGIDAPDAEKVFSLASSSLRNANPDPAQKDLAVRSLRAVSAASPDKAAQLATGLPDAALRTQELQAATAGWARRDEAGARLWIQNSPGLNPKDREELLKTLQTVSDQKKSKPAR